MEDKSKPWVDGPFELIPPSRSGAEIGKKLNPARALAAEMSTVHNGLIRSVNSVYNQCINVATKGTTKDKSDFANYAKQCALLLHEHHDFEEETLFPGFNELAGVPGLMDGNVAEHHEFHDGLATYEAYLDGVKEQPDTLDGEKLRALVDGFMPALYKHLVNEIDTLVALEKYEGVDFNTWFNNEVEKFNKGLLVQSDFRTKMLPLFLCLHDGTYADGIWKGFPPMPFLLLIILRFLFMHRNADWWRFAGCDLYSRPKELPFA